MQARQAPEGDEQHWEHRLFPLLCVAFAVAAGASLASARALPARVTEPLAWPLAPPTSASPTLESRGETLVLLRVADVIVSDGEGTSAILLMDGAAEIVLPVFVAAEEGEAVRLGLAGASGGGRAPAHALLRETVAALGAQVERVEVVFGPDPAVGQVVLRRGTEQIILDARTGEALGLAVATGTPVYVARRVLGNRGIPRAAVRRPPAGLPSNLHAPEHL